MSTITLVLTPPEAQRLYTTFAEHRCAPPAYAEWQLRVENCVITRYTSGKTVFQGKDAEVYAAAFRKPESGPVLPQAGSDEVGTGDYFGPVTVCACIVDERTVSLIRSLCVTDSKELNDAKIRTAAPQLMEALPHSLLVVSPAKYNEVHTAKNLNEMKSMLHNQAYIHLKNRYGLPALCVIDQFTPPASYWKYLSGQPTVIRPIHFETKAESHYPAVAAASVIARYAFLCEMDRMEKTYGMTFAKGAGAPADRCAAEFVERFGFDRLPEAAKMHFRNTAKLKGR